MKIPSNMTEQEVLSIIDNVANRLARRFKFGYHEMDDMKQQARLFACEGLDAYDEIRPLENFLWTHVHNRLFNFKRDKYERPDNPCKKCKESSVCITKVDCYEYNHWINRNSRKKNLMYPVAFDSVDDINEDNMKYNVASEELFDYKTIIDIIDKELPINMRSLYLKLKLNTKLTKSQKTKIQQIIKEILIKNGYGNRLEARET